MEERVRACEGFVEGLRSRAEVVEGSRGKCEIDCLVRSASEGVISSGFSLAWGTGGADTGEAGLVTLRVSSLLVKAMDIRVRSAKEGRGACRAWLGGGREGFLNSSASCCIVAS